MPNESGPRGSAETTSIDLSIIHEDLAAINVEEIRAQLRIQSKTLLDRMKAANPRSIAGIQAILLQHPEKDNISGNFDEDLQLEFETDLAEESGDYNKTLQYLLVTVSLQIQSSGTPWAITCLRIADQFSKLGNFNKAKTYYKLAIEIKLEIERDEKEDNADGIVGKAREKLLSLSPGEIVN